MTRAGVRACLGAAFEALFPRICLACHHIISPALPGTPPTPGGLCSHCQPLVRPLDLDRICNYCGASPPQPASDPASPRCYDCQNLPAAFQCARSIFPYLGPAGAIIRTMKYRSAPYVAEELVALCLQERRDWLADYLHGRLLIPVPMHPVRELQRGFNQAEEIANALAKALGISVENGLLRRVKKASPQARRRTRQARFENLEGCFEVSDPLAVKDRNLVLIDDVMTSGATVARAALTLQDCKPASIRVFTPVRARLGEDEEENAEGS